MDTFSVFHWLIALIVVVVGLWPIAMILKRIGYSPWWSILALLGPIGWIGMWVLAYARWPIENGKR
jgi:hypothetical protein